MVPSRTVMFPKEVNPDIATETIWVQEDGAPPHFFINAREDLNDIFASIAK